MESNTIHLDEEQRKKLARYGNTGKHNAMLVRRAKVIMALDRTGKKDHLRIGRICESVGISRNALNEIRRDFLAAESIEAFLTRKKRKTPPVPLKITGDVEAHIIALACSKAPEGYARWTVRLLCNKSIELGYTSSIAPSTMHQLLKKRSINLT